MFRVVLKFFKSYLDWDVPFRDIMHMRMIRAEEGFQTKGESWPGAGSPRVTLLKITGIPSLFSQEPLAAFLAFFWVFFSLIVFAGFFLTSFLVSVLLLIVRAPYDPGCAPTA
jgi:hypothetical protein